MNIEMSHPLTNVSMMSANDAHYASPGDIGRIDRVCRIVAGMLVLVALTSGMIVVPALIFAAALVGFYLIQTVIVGQDPFYALVGNHPSKRFASLSALSSTLSLSAVLSGQFFVPEVISVLGLIGAVTGLTAVHHAGSWAMSTGKVQPISTLDTQGLSPANVTESQFAQEVIADQRVA